MADIKTFYAKELKKLTLNSKPIINHLTKLAGEHTHAADIIVQLLEEETLEAPFTLKLTHLYLVDSILKNIGEPYLTACNAVIYRLYSEAYRSVDEQTRYNFQRVLKTWMTLPLSPDVIQRLERFTEQQKQLSSAQQRQPLPDTQPAQGMKRSAAAAGFSDPSVATAIAGNASGVRSTASANGPRPSLSPPAGARNPIPTSIRFQPPKFPGVTLRDKIYLDICMLLLKKEEDVAARIPNASSELSVLTQLQQIFHGQGVPDTLLDKIADQLNVVAASTRNCPPLLSATFRNPTKQRAGPPSAAAAAKPTPPVAGIVPPEIMANLKRHGFDASTLARPDPAVVTFSAEDLKRPRYDAISLLYQALPHQCRQCGFRFPAHQKRELDDHLDWHFRMNRKLRDRSKRAISRDWFLDEVEWLRGKTEELNARATNQTQDDVGPAEKVKVEAPRKLESTPLLPDEDSTTVTCAVCREKLETFWDDKAEAWLVRDAIRNEADQKLYHPPCYADMMTHLAEPTSPQ